MKRLDGASAGLTARLVTSALLAGLLGVAQQAQAATGIGSALKGAQTVVLEKSARNQMEWLSEAPGEKIRGSAPGLTGEVTLDPADLASLRGKLTVPVAEMKTGNDMRDRHLKGRSWLDAGAFPHITFEIKGVSEVKAAPGEASFKATGTFTLHGVSKELSAPITLKWKDAGGGAKVKVETRFEVALADYNIQGKAGVVGDKVGKTIAIWGTLYGATR